VSTVLFVSTEGSDTNDCRSSGAACRTVQRAIEVANEGDIVKAATGVYTDDDTARLGYVVALTKTIVLRGGYDSTFADPPDGEENPSILDARDEGRVIRITGDISPTVEGFVITGGNATGLGGGFHEGTSADAGGGIYVQSAAPLIVNNVISGNTASNLRTTAGQGGGIGMRGVSASTVISGNEVIGNTASTGFKGQGGGICLTFGVATISNNQVTTNTGSTADSSSGGGLYVSDSEGTITGNVLRSNRASVASYGVGGGAAIFDSHDVVFSSNQVRFNIASTAGYGKAGGVGFKRSSNLVVSDNYVQGNICSTASWGSGGGILLKYTLDSEVSGNTVLLNTAGTKEDGQGGGFYIAEDSRLTLSNNRVQGNVASRADDGRGGGLFLWSCDVTLINNMIFNNRANTVGSGIFIQGATPRLVHNTIAHNRGGNGSGIYVIGNDPEHPSSVTLTNTILLSHTVGITVAAGSTATLEGTLWGSGDWANETDWAGTGVVNTGTINIWGDPAFVDPSNGYYRILECSSAVDRGVATDVATDIDGEARPNGDGYDIGADEFHANPNLSVIKQAHPDPVQTGAPLTYVIRVENTSTETLTATVTDLLPDTVTPTGVLEWAPIYLTPDDVWTETVVVTVEPGHLGSVTNVVYAMAGDGGLSAARCIVAIEQYDVYLPTVVRNP
jgi:hypothetical protein